MTKTTPAQAGSPSIATDITAPLILDFLQWLAAEPRPYAEVMDGWRTSCPRLTIWEDAVDGGYVVRKRDGRLEAVVEVTLLGHQFLSEARRGMVSSNQPRPCSAP
ncbi:MAG TPA: hypothetical protein VII42_14720 [Caulobacteraceae bacterium]|jgi:hypothetical protein